MGASVQLSAVEAFGLSSAEGRVPVPTPPHERLVRPRLVEQSPRAARREHEVQQVIRDLAALSVARGVQVS